MLAVIDPPNDQNPNGPIIGSNENNNAAAVPIQYIVANLDSDPDDAEYGSLRDVISEVNADPISKGADQITVATDIAGGTITLQSPLPALTRNQVTITGPITLEGSIAGMGDGLDISGDQDSVQNLTVTGFSGAGISTTGNDGCISMSHVTDDQNGIVISDDQNGIVVSGGATGNTIGGTAAGAAT